MVVLLSAESDKSLSCWQPRKEHTQKPNPFQGVLENNRTGEKNCTEIQKKRAAAKNTRNEMFASHAVLTVFI